ncbi:hypothetical protein [Streptomyces sp. NPDC054849]
MIECTARRKPHEDIHRQLGTAERLLREDAAARRVHAVRVRIDTAVRENVRRPALTGVGRIRADASRLEPSPQTPGGDRPPIRFQPMSGHHTAAFLTCLSHRRERRPERPEPYAGRTTRCT